MDIYLIFESIDYSMSSVMFAFKLNIEKFFKFVICMINLFFYNIGLNMMIYKIVSESIIQTWEHRWGAGHRLSEG